MINEISSASFLTLFVVPCMLYHLGNMWGQTWASLSSRTTPYPDVPNLDATEAMKKQGYTVKKMFEVSNDFFKDLGLLEMTPTFWKNSLIERPPDGRAVQCHPTAEDFCMGKGSDDFR